MATYMTRTGCEERGPTYSIIIARHRRVSATTSDLHLDLIYISSGGGEIGGGSGVQSLPAGPVRYI